MQADAAARAFDALSQHPRLADLAAVARASMAAAADARRAEREPERVQRAAADLGLTREDAGTPFGNALDVLQRGPEDAAERALACALAAHVVALDPPKGADAMYRAVNDWLWLATHTPFDATGLLDKALGGAADEVWVAVTDRIRRIDQGQLPSLGKGEGLVAAAALASSPTKAAARSAGALAAEVEDRKLARVLRAAAAEPAPPVLGELAPRPRGPVATTLLALTGVLVVMHLARLVGRLVLAYKKPAELTLEMDGSVRLRWRVELLGRRLGDRSVVVPRAALVRATREVRYPRVAIYAGLTALLVGSYVGVSAFVDGVRAASPSLLASGLAIVALGLALDFALSSLAPGARGTCRLWLVLRDGAMLCVGRVDPRQADALLARLAQPLDGAGSRTLEGSGPKRERGSRALEENGPTRQRG
jgi:hypothetical protein